MSFYKFEAFRDRKFELILYPDDLSFNNQHDFIARNYDYVRAFHDKDIYVTEEEISLHNDYASTNNHVKYGDLKKAHYHYIITGFHNPIWSTALSKYVGCTRFQIYPISRLAKAYQYLIHKNNPEKYQYSTDVVDGNNYYAFEQALEDEVSKAMELNAIIKYIDSCYHFLSTMDVYNFVWDNRFYKVFRCNFPIICAILKEHNLKYLKKDENGDLLK